MRLYELNKKLKIARQRDFIFNQIHKLTLKIYSHLRYINIRYYLKFQLPMCHRPFFKFFKILSQIPEYVERFCNVRIILFTFQFANE